MGLIEPSLFAYVQWPDIVPNITWGISPNTQTINDEALLFQWPAQGPDSGMTQVMGSFSYGTAAAALTRSAMETTSMRS